MLPCMISRAPTDHVRHPGRVGHLLASSRDEQHRIRQELHCNCTPVPIMSLLVALHRILWVKHALSQRCLDGLRPPTSTGNPGSVILCTNTCSVGWECSYGRLVNGQCITQSAPPAD